MSTALIILVQLITAMATVAIAFFGYQSYKLTKEIKNASNKQHEDMKDLSLALITTSLYIAKYSHTTQKDVPIEGFYKKFEEVKTYFRDMNQQVNQQ